MGVTRREFDERAYTGDPDPIRGPGPVLRSEPVPGSEPILAPPASLSELLCPAGGEPPRIDPDAFARAVQTAVIPRLLLAERALAERSARSGGGGPVADVEELVGRVLVADEMDLDACVEGLFDRDTSVEALFLELLAPTARRLGEMWEDDQCDFIEVTVGLWRLQQIARRLSPELEDPTAGLRPQPRILLLPVPGEQHTFGLGIVIAFFRRNGWAVTAGEAANLAALARLLERERFEIVGFSHAAVDELQTLAAAVRTVRRSRRNGGAWVMVGGPPFATHPELAAQVGADATAQDGEQAVRQAQRLLAAAHQEV